MANRKPLSVKPFMIVHNIFLSVASLVLLVLITSIIGKAFVDNDLFYVLCSPELGKIGELEFYYYINYLLKYYELLDTVFLVVNKKPLDFLHVYHHSATLVLCYTQLWGNNTVQWLPITANLIVHTVMYYYYAQVALGNRVWWKQWVTVLQIAQFILDVVAVNYCVYRRVLFEYIDPSVEECKGTMSAAWVGWFTLHSYLVLFIQFYNKTYKPKAKSQ